jgi:methyl-accepting chemotaxis protein
MVARPTVIPQTATGLETDSMNPTRLGLGPRIALAFGATLLLMVAVVIIAITSLRTTKASIDLVNLDRYPKVAMATEIGEQINQQARALRNLLIMDSRADREAQFAEVADSRKQIAATLEKLAPMLQSAEGRQLMADVMARRQAYMAAVDVFMKMARSGDDGNARTQLLEHVRPPQLAYMASLAKLTKFQEQLMEQAGAQAATDVQRATWLIGGAAAAALVLSVVLGVLVTRSVTRPVAHIVGTLRRVADGDLSTEVDVNRADEIGQLQQALKVTTESLRRVVGEVRRGVDSVTTAADQIAAGNLDLSSRTEQQASSLQQTAASMEQLNGTVQHSADNARQANQLAAASSAAAGKGGEVVQQVVSTMAQITQASHRIADIIGVIDGIAFQTNILALNAAVEAARAGEQGRGFAVVASEVRSLAQRSAAAAREIKALIGSSVDQVEVGARQVAEAGHAMQDIVGQVRRVTDLVGEIAGAAQEQSSGIGQVNQAVAQMDQVTQQNAALVEESAAAAQSLAAQAQRLADAVSVFRLAPAA